MFKDISFCVSVNSVGGTSVEGCAYSGRRTHVSRSKCARTSNGVRARKMGWGTRMSACWFVYITTAVPLHVTISMEPFAPTVS